MKPVLKAGAIILSAQDTEKILILHQDERNDFSFPKGHLEAGETLEQCTIREVKEETGLDIKLLESLPVIRYTNTFDGDVEVTYFVARSLNDNTVQTEVGGTVYWATIDEALEKISYENLRELLKSALSVIAKYKNS